MKLYNNDKIRRVNGKIINNQKYSDKTFRPIKKNNQNNNKKYNNTANADKETKVLSNIGFKEIKVFSNNAFKESFNNSMPKKTTIHRFISKLPNSKNNNIANHSFKEIKVTQDNTIKAGLNDTKSKKITSQNNKTFTNNKISDKHPYNSIDLNRIINNSQADGEKEPDKQTEQTNNMQIKSINQNKIKKEYLAIIPETNEGYDSDTSKNKPTTENNNKNTNKTITKTRKISKQTLYNVKKKENQHYNNSVYKEIKEIKNDNSRIKSDTKHWNRVK